MGKHANKHRDYDLDCHPTFINRKKFDLKDLCSFSPKSENQATFIESYLNTDCDTFGLFGYPGTGKTFLAIRCGFVDVLDHDVPEYDKLIIVRSAVETRDTGFKPGDETDKNMVYAKPYYGLMQDVFNLNHDKIFENLLDIGKVKFETTSNERGVTWDNAIVVMDEVQNMTYGEIRTIYSRGGKNCRYIMCGDVGQNDLVKKSSDKSGLQDWIKVMDGMGDTSITEFYSLDDIVRSGRIQRMIKREIELGFV